MSKYIDGVDWIVNKYFSVISNKEFTYKGDLYKPKFLMVSPLLCRSVDCFENCGACCLCGSLKSSLDYLPSEKPKSVDRIERREVIINHGAGDIKVEMFSDFQLGWDIGGSCSYLRMTDGRCNIYQERPFNCDFALIMTSRSSNPKRPHRMLTRHFGRHWCMKRVTGDRGMLCKINEVSADAKQEVIRKLTRLEEWADHFRFTDTRIPAIIKWLNSRISVPQDPLYFHVEKRKVGIV